MKISGNITTDFIEIKWIIREQYGELHNYKLDELNKTINSEKDIFYQDDLRKKQKLQINV